MWDIKTRHQNHEPLVLKLWYFHSQQPTMWTPYSNHHLWSVRAVILEGSSDFFRVFLIPKKIWGELLPRNLTWNLKWWFPKGITFSRDFFSGSMLNFRGTKVSKTSNLLWVYFVWSLSFEHLLDGPSCMPFQKWKWLHCVHIEGMKLKIQPDRLKNTKCFEERAHFVLQRNRLEFIFRKHFWVNEFQVFVPTTTEVYWELLWLCFKQPQVNLAFVGGELHFVRSHCLLLFFFWRGACLVNKNPSSPA